VTGHGLPGLKIHYIGDTVMKKTYETQLPDGYKEAMVIDAKSKKFGLIVNILAVVITVVSIAVSFLVIGPVGFEKFFSLSRYLVFLVILFAYIVLHELTHGLAYWLLTKRKLTFGVSLTVAYCGVPDIFVYRKTALISLLSPFTVFTVIFLGAAILLPEPVDKLYALILFSVHFGGCAGDLYDTFIYLTRFRDPTVLMQDTGPKQTFYVKSSDPDLNESHVAE